MKGMARMLESKIVVIDSGINESSVIEHNLSEFYSLEYSNGKYQLVSASPSDNIGHGTAVANIIFNYDENAKFIVIKMCNFEMNIEENGLLYVLNYIYENIEATIINISMGYTYSEHLDELEDVCERLLNKGVLIVSAFDNVGAVSYPACLKSVIGVDVCDEYEKKTDIYRVENSIVDIQVPNVYYRTIWKDKKTIIKGTSFACAKITGLISSNLYKLNNNSIIEKYDVLNLIADKSKNTIKANPFPKPSFEIHRAIIFPYNKESSALLKYSDLVGFEIAGVYDERLHGNIGKIIEGYNIQPFDAIVWDDETFDTIILSCLSELVSLTKQNYLGEILSKAEKYGKNIYTFEDIKITSEHVFYPYINSTLTPNYNAGKLNKTTLPIVGVFGTSSKQGKFTLQLEIIRRMSNDGYRVGHISTEPSGYLFGADYVYHFGYHANLNIMPWECIAIINQMIGDVQRSNKDLLIIGSQSNTLHYDDSCINDFKIDQLAIMLGSMPDYFVLCVNPHDEIEYIRRTINYINAIGCGKVKALVVFPITIVETITHVKYKSSIMPQDELECLKSRFHSIFELPVFILGNEVDMRHLCINIIEYFSTE